LPGCGLPSPGDNRKHGATSTVANALPGYGHPSPGDSRKCAATSTTAQNKRQKNAMPETAITPTNVSEAESRATPMNVSEAQSTTPIMQMRLKLKKIKYVGFVVVPRVTGWNIQQSRLKKWKKSFLWMGSEIELMH
jgi:hypothetical protein